MDVPVIVVGAGPSGLVLAIELRRRGIDCVVVEQLDRLFEGARGKGLQPRTLEVFDDLGVLARVFEYGCDYPELLVHLPDGQTMTRSMGVRHEATEDRPYPNMWMLPQWRTGEILAARLTELGGRIEFGTGLVGFTQQAEGVRVRLSSGGVEREITARYLIGADGGKSAVRKALGIGFIGETRDEERMVVADVRIPGLDRGHWHVWPDADGRSIRLGLCPLPSTEDVQLTMPVGDGEPPALPEYVKEVAGFDDVTVRWHSVWRANIRLVERYRVGDVFLAGDAAHIHSPAGGQGLNTGIQDAYNLGWKLAAVLAGADAALLDTYEEERMPIAGHVLGISTRLHRKYVDREDDAMVRDDPELRQLLLNYRGGPLAEDDDTVQGPIRAGDRAPDAIADGATGTRIFDLLRGPHATLLAIGVPIDDLRQRFGDRFPVYDIGSVTRHYGSEGLFFIRPDGYVGVVASTADTIDAYARRLGL